MTKAPQKIQKNPKKKVKEPQKKQKNAKTNKNAKIGVKKQK